MPATSKSQQRFMALVKLYLEGKIKNPSESVRRAAKSMTLEDANDFASTKHEGLPEKKTAQFIVVPSVLAYLAYKRKKKQEAEKSKEETEDRLEKAAWQKTPVMIQNKELVYEFESLEEACQYLASIGTLTYDEVEKMLDDRESLINGFQVTYPSEKIAGIVVIDPWRKQREMLRAMKVHDMIMNTDNSKEDRDEFKKHNDKKSREGAAVLDDLVGVSDDTIETIANLLRS